MQTLGRHECNWLVRGNATGGQVERNFPIGSLITIIGISLMPAAAIWLGGGNLGADDFGSPANLLLGLVTVTITITLAVYAKFSGFIGNLTPANASELDNDLLRQTIQLSEESKPRGRHPFAALVADQNGKVSARCTPVPNLAACAQAITRYGNERYFSPRQLLPPCRSPTVADSERFSQQPVKAGQTKDGSHRPPLGAQPGLVG